MKKYFINAVDYGCNYNSGLRDVRYEVTEGAPREGARTLRSQEVVSAWIDLGLKVRIDLGLPLSRQDCTPEIWVQSTDFRAKMARWDGKMAGEFIPAAELFSEYNSLAYIAQLRNQWWRGDAHPELYEDDGEAYVLTAEGQTMRDEARARRAEILAQIEAACCIFDATAIAESKSASAPELEPSSAVVIPAGSKCAQEPEQEQEQEVIRELDLKLFNADAEKALASILGGNFEEEYEEEEEEEESQETAIINMTQHAATAEQLAAGVVDFVPEIKAQVQALLTFDTLPSAREIRSRAEKLTALVESWGFTRAMIGGAPFLMGALETALKNCGITPLYAFSVRDSVEKQNPDGSVTKQNVFKHAGFIEV